jgi:hypothetical protein
MASLEEAFPQCNGPPEREKKKKRKHRSSETPLPYLEEVPDVDPDRPACKRMPYVEAFQDLSGGSTLPGALASMTKVANAKPVTKIPSYFGKGVDDEEPFANYSNTIGDDPSYRLEPDFTQMFLGKGLEKAQGTGSLPAPNLNDSWKPLTANGVPTASFLEIPQPISAPAPSIPSAIRPSEESDAMARKIDYLYRRIAELDTQRGKNSQTEILMFVGTGLGLILMMHLLTSRR